MKKMLVFALVLGLISITVAAAAQPVSEISIPLGDQQMAQVVGGDAAGCILGSVAYIGSVAGLLALSAATAGATLGLILVAHFATGAGTAVACAEWLNS